MKRVNKSTSRVQSDRKGNDDRVVLCTLCIRAFEVGLRYECMKIVRLFLGDRRQGSDDGIPCIRYYCLITWLLSSLTLGGSIFGE
jgi:hypothetical protein